MKFLNYIFVFCVLVTSGTVLGIAYDQIFNLALILVPIIHFLIRRSDFNIKIKLSKINLINLSIIVVIVGFFANHQQIQYFENSLGLIVFIGKMIWFAYYIAVIIRSGCDFLKISAHLIFVISLISLIAYVLIFHFKIEFLPMFRVKEMLTYGFLVNTFGVDFLAKSGIVRNSGIFYEPGLYQVYLNFALLYYLFIRLNLWIVSTLIFSLVLTFSPIGYALSLLILICFLGYCRFSPVIRVFIIIFVFVFGSFFLLEFLFLKEDTYSYFLRINDMLIGIDLFLQKPLLGWGLRNETPIQSYYITHEALERGGSNGLVALLYQTGIFLFAIYFYGFYKLGKALLGHWALVFFSWVIISLFSQNVYLSNFMVCLLFCGYCCNKKAISGNSCQFNWQGVSV